VTNELLKIVAEFRERDGRLLVCATNFVRALDAAFLRHGRFDYVIPIGLPDGEARAAIWRRYIPAAAAEATDIAALVAASDGLTPADIEYAARRLAGGPRPRAARRRGSADGSEGDAGDGPGRMPAMRRSRRPTIFARSVQRGRRCRPRRSPTSSPTSMSTPGSDRLGRVANARRFAKSQQNRMPGHPFSESVGVFRIW
jgi:hypothetical protein